MHERTFIGLDVHARSIQAGVLDGLTGEVEPRRPRGHGGAGRLGLRAAGAGSRL